MEHVNRRSSSRILNQKRLKYEVDDGDKETNEEEEEDQEDDEQPNTSEHTKRTQPSINNTFRTIYLLFLTKPAVLQSVRHSLRTLSMTLKYTQYFCS